MKLILCEGDSWTSGDLINPELELAGKEHPNVNDSSNDDYRLPKVWPHKLGKRLGIDIVNKSGSWFSYNETKLGQGRDAVKQMILDNPELCEEIETKIKEISA